MSSDQLANHLGIPVIVARERFVIVVIFLKYIDLDFFRLISAETYGFLCRDDSIEGLRFYPNLF